MLQLFFLLLAICLFPTQVIRSIQWARAIILDLFFMTMFLPIRLISIFSSRSTTSLHGSHRPILLVHGYLNSDFVWLFLKNFLKKKGFGPIYTIKLGSPLASIETFAQKVQKKADQIAQETGRSDLTLIGHSMGGVISTYYALQVPQKDLRIITIGSPLKGTHVAKIGLGRCAREMEIGSKLMQKIQQAENHQSLYHIGTTTDQLIVPFHSAFLIADPLKISLFQDLGHISLLFSPRIAKKICEFLD